MVDYFGAGQDLLKGIGGFISGLDTAEGDRAAAKSYAYAAQMTKLETGIKEVQAGREIYKVLGGQRADVAANGLLASGSAADVMRSSAQQGGITKALIGIQGNIEYQSYLAQSEYYKSAADAAETGGFFDLAGGIVGAAGAFI